MKFTKQFMTAISLCILTVVVMVLIGASISFYRMGVMYQERQVAAVVRLINEGWHADVPQQVDIEHWLPALLDVNDIVDFSILRANTVLYRYQPAQDRQAGDDLTMTYQVPLSADPELSIRLILKPPFYDIDHSLAALSGISGAIVLVLIGTLFMLRWLRRQLRGVELLDLRSQYILQNRLNLVQHDARQEWPHHASQALDKLLAALKDANKERSRFDSFMRANVFVDKKLGIGNRVFFDNRLEAALSDPACHSGALLLVEIQDLARINYHFGDERGDELLSSASIYMGHLVRRSPGALQARYTGNTFALLFPNLVESEAQEAAAQVMKLLRRLNWPDDRDAAALFIGGVCFRYGEQVSQVQEEAELALRSAVLQEGDGCFIYAKGITEESMGMGKGTVRWRTLLSRLLAQNKIRLARQGICTAPGQVPGMYELLASIEDEQGRELSADYFLPMAEKCGLLTELDSNIVSQAITQVRQHDFGPALAVHVSATSLLQGEFYRWLVFELLQLPKAQLKRLVLELSEAHVSRHFQALGKPLRALKALGCQLAVDHAGQDVVSTQYIKDYGLDYLKLHPSLVRDIDSKPINQMAVRSLIGNSTGNQTQVIAMGVASEAEWLCLARLGVQAGQGSFFASAER